MFELKKIVDKSDIRKAKALYKEAFPIDERMPYFMLKSFADGDKCDFFMLYENGFSGLMFTVYYNDIVYIFYLAVSPDKRGLGYGTKALEEAKRLFDGKRIILNMEELDEKYDNFSQRVKRARFYEANGFVMSDYKTAEKDVVYEMLYYGGYVSYDEYSSLIENLFGKFIFKRFYKKISK